MTYYYKLFKSNLLKTQIQMVEIVNPIEPTEVDSNSHVESASVEAGTISNTDSALHESDRSSDSSFVNTKDDTSS